MPHPFFKLAVFSSSDRNCLFILPYGAHTITVPKNQSNVPKEETTMSNRSSNKAVVPEAKGALDRFKYEVANELGVPLTEGYNGDLTSRQNGSVGGYMVKKMIEAQEKQMAGK